jgi:hypothetical protein
MDSPERAIAPEVAALLFEVSSGSLEMTRFGCSVAAARPAAGAAPADLRKALTEAIYEQTQTQLLALFAAMLESEWTITAARRVPRAPNIPLPRRRRGPNEPAMDRALESDPIFTTLRDRLGATPPPDLPESVSRIREAAVQLGTTILGRATEAERVRLVAFAIGELIESPMDAVDATYTPAFEDEGQELNAGLLLAELLLDADPNVEFAVTEQMFADTVARQDLEIVPEHSEWSPFQRLARRLRKIQRRLGIYPPIFPIDEANGRIVLWQPSYALVFGDIRPALKRLLESRSEDYE